MVFLIYLPNDVEAFRLQRGKNFEQIFAGHSLRQSKLKFSLK